MCEGFECEVGEYSEEPEPPLCLSSGGAGGVAVKKQNKTRRVKKRCKFKLISKLQMSKYRFRWNGIP